MSARLSNLCPQLLVQNQKDNFSNSCLYKYRTKLKNPNKQVYCRHGACVTEMLWMGQTLLIHSWNSNWVFSLHSNYIKHSAALSLHCCFKILLTILVLQLHNHYFKYPYHHNYPKNNFFLFSEWSDKLQAQILALRKQLL